MAQTRSYDQYLTRVAGMIGLPVSGMTADEKGFLNADFNNNVRSMWQLNNWLDVCPYGEARFAGNVLRYTNDISQAIYWTPTGATITRNSLANPMDNRLTACTVAETVANSQHGISQIVNFLPSNSYTFSTYVRPIAGRYIYIAANDGVNTYRAFFNLVTGVVVSQVGLMSTASIQPQANGFYLCTISFATAQTAGVGSVSLLSSSDGSTLTYAGSTSAGLYLWGNLLQQTSNTSANAYSIPWEQDGENAIDAVFQVMRSNPNGSPYPQQQGYNLGLSGIHLIGTGGYSNNYYNTIPSFSSPITNPVFLYYRRTPPDYLGAAYNALTGYTVGATILYTYADGVKQNYFTCAVATSAGQNPENTAANWTLSTIYDFTFQYACYAGYADWLRQDGQADKATLMDQMAQKQMDDESDRMERQQGHVLPTTFSTHVTSQSRY